MSGYSAQTLWSRQATSEADFLTGRYHRGHVLRFDGGIEVAGSASPLHVPPAYAEGAALDPEEAFVSALSSCHMLWFLALAGKQGYCVDTYDDDATGTLERDARGRLAMTVVTLRPAVAFSGSKLPDADELARLHHEAHDSCYIASSVTTDVRCEPRHAA